MNATIHEIVSALAPTALVECIQSIGELSTPTQAQAEFRYACETALIALVGEVEAKQLLGEMM